MPLECGARIVGGVLDAQRAQHVGDDVRAVPPGARAGALDRWGASFCSVTPGLLSGEVSARMRDICAAVATTALRTCSRLGESSSSSLACTTTAASTTQGAVDRRGDGPGDDPRLPRGQRPALDGDPLQLALQDHRIGRSSGESASAGRSRGTTPSPWPRQTRAGPCPPHRRSAGCGARCARRCGSRADSPPGLRRWPLAPAHPDLRGVLGLGGQLVEQRAQAMDRNLLLERLRAQVVELHPQAVGARQVVLADEAPAAPGWPAGGTRSSGAARGWC